MIAIKEETCIGCGRCKAVCPMAVISMVKGKAKPVTEACINCGHCQGICPVDAVVIEGVEENLQTAIQQVSYEDLKNCIKSNRSIRLFQDTLVEEEKILEVLRTLDYSASAKNDQPVQWVVVSGKEKVEEVSKMSMEHLPKNHPLFGYIEAVRNPVTVNAPHLLIAYANEKFEKGHDDCVIKMTLATLLFHSQGIGSCFLGFLDGFIAANPKLQEHLGIEKGCRVYSALGFGYNDKEVYKKIPTRKKANVKIIQ